MSYFTSFIRGLLCLPCLLCGVNAHAQQPDSFITQIIGKDTIVLQVPVTPGARYVSFEEPEFPGDIQVFREQHLSLPVDKSGKVLEGIVSVLFIVRLNGSIENPRVIKSTNDALNEAALQFIKQLPPWLPARMDAQPVDKGMVVLEIPFTPEK